MEEQSVKVEKNGHISTIILSRPHAKNAVDSKTAQALVSAFQDFESDENAKVAVLWGANGTFCAGADLKEVSSNTRTDIKSVGESHGPMGPSRMVLKKPCIAAVSGYAVAGGLELALLCDMRVVEEDSVMGVFCRRWGVPLIDGGTVRLPRLIGLSRALDLILTGRPVGAQEALQMGLANRIVPKGQSRFEAEKLATLISNFPQICMRNDRLSAYEQFDLSFEDAMHNEFNRGVKSLTSESVSGAQRFAQNKEGRGGSFDSFTPKL